jgi:hypothetical protein
MTFEQIDDFITDLARRNLPLPAGLVLKDDAFDELKKTMARYTPFVQSGNATTYRGLILVRQTMVFPPCNG